MNTTDKPATAAPATSSGETLVSIETALLDDVTGGCDGCGTPSAVHAEPANTSAAGTNRFNVASAR